MQSLLGKFAADRKLGRVADGPECCAAVSKDLNKLQRWVERNRRNQGPCRRGGTTPCPSTGCGLTGVQSRAGGCEGTRASRVSVGKKANGILGCIGSNVAAG